MTTTTTRKPRKVNPVRCDCAAHGRLIYPCDLLPAGVPVRVSLNGTDYLLSAHGTAPEAGYRFTKLGGNGAVYDIDVSLGYPVCDCPDCEYNQRACKHCVCLDRLHEQGVC